MLEDEVFKKCSFDYNKLIKYGFKKKDNKYIYEVLFHDNEYRAIISISSNKVIGKVIEVSFNEEYNNIRVKDIVGEYVNNIKNEYIEILNDIKNKCCIVKYFIYDQSNRIVDIIKNKYNVVPEFLWEDDDAGALRHNNTKKWFGIIMNVGRNKVDKSKNKDIVEVLNIKLDKNIIKELVNKKGYYNAYHMNKKSWISIILDDTLSDKEILKYIDDSFNITDDIRTWIVPANPKIFDVEKYITNKKIIDWPKKKNMLIDDIIYVYYAKPFGALLLKGIIVGMNNNYMQVKILDRYDNTKYPLEILKEHGLNSVRSTRRISKELLEFLK